MRNDDRDGAATEFELAAAGFGNAEDLVSGPLVAPARAIPIVGQHLVAIDEMASAGQTLAATSADTIAELDLDRLTFDGGRIDLDLIAALEQPAADLVKAASDARQTVDDARSGWLIPPVADRIDELAAELDDAIVAGQTTVDAVRVAPYFLGADEPRRYLVEFSSPAESRELGGLMGGYGYLTADDGKLDFDSRGASTELIPALVAANPPKPDIELPSPFLLQAPMTEPRAWTGTADFPTAAATARASLAGIGETVDGVILVDPYTLAALMEFTGPVTIPEIEREIRPEDAVDFLLRQQYLEFDEDAASQEERKDLLGELGGQVFDRLTNGALPAPPKLASVLAPLVEQRRLLAVVDDPDAMDLLDETGLSGRLGVAEDEPGEQVISVASTNLRAGKLDAYVTRAIDVRGRVAANGEIRGTVSIEIQNFVPTSGLNSYVLADPEGIRPDGLPPTTHWMFAAVYSTVDIVEATVDGRLVVLGAEPAYGMTRYSVLVKVPQGESVEVELRISDRVDPRAFSLRYVPFAAAIPDDVRISIATP